MLLSIRNMVNYPKPAMAKLSVVIPAYNSEAWIGPTLRHLSVSLKASNWKSVEIIIVDDGSSDNTADAAQSYQIEQRLKIIKQKNAGRFTARKTGLDAASGDYVFFIDSRVFTSRSAFSYVTKQMQANPDAIVWNGHVEVERKKNPYARFWHTVTFIAWRRYMANPRLVHYGIDDLEYYPKGTTCFLAPRELFIKAYKNFSTSYKDLRNANDDTALIRIIASQTDIYMAPQFAFTYHSRSTLKAFTKHTVHRGVVFVDGFLHSNNRYFRFLAAYLTLAPVFVVGAAFRPIILLAIPAIMALVWLTTLILKVNYKDATAFIIVLPVFSIFYTVGLYKGLMLRFVK